MMLPILLLYFKYRTYGHYYNWFHFIFFAEKHINFMKYKLIVTTFVLFLTIDAFAQRGDRGIDYRRPLFDYKENTSVFSLDSGQRNNRTRFLRYNVLSGYREGVNPTSGPFGLNFDFKKDTASGTVRLFMINLSIEQMLSLGFYESFRIVLEVNDPSKYRYLPEYGSELEWKRNNLWCYEAVFPQSVNESIPIALNHLSSLFGLRTSKERRMVDVLVLRRYTEKDKLKTFGGGMLIDKERGVFHNVLLKDVVQSINTKRKLQMKDESEYSGAVDLEVDPNSWSDNKKLSDALHKYGLELREERREMDVFVITETGGKKLNN